MKKHKELSNTNRFIERYQKIEKIEKDGERTRGKKRFERGS